MSKDTFNEANYEQAIIELFRDQLGYEYIYGPDIERDYTEPLFLERLQQSLLAINPSLPEVAIHEVIEKIRQIDYEQHMQSIKAAIPSKNIIAPRSTMNLANGRTNP